MVYNNSTKSHLFVKSQIFILQVILEIIYTNTPVSWMRKIKLIKIYLHSSRKPLCSRVMTRTNFCFSVPLSLDPFSCNLDQILGALPLSNPCVVQPGKWTLDQKLEGGTLSTVSSFSQTQTYTFKDVTGHMFSTSHLK